jgi:predicted metal-binding protein
MSSSPVSSCRQKKIIGVDSDLEKYGARAIEVGATGVKQIHPSSVVTAGWVRWKCQFGCPGYGKGHCCPPRTPSHDRTREMLDSYRRALLFHIRVAHMQEEDKPLRDYFDALSEYFDALVALEGEMFKDGYYKAFVFLSGPCRLCEKCGALEDKPCALPWKARPSMEACGIDVFQTAQNHGFLIETLRERADVNNEYCLIVVD